MRTIKQISLALILIVGLIFIFNGCQKEYISSTPKSDIVLKRITYEDINLNSKLKKSIINIRSKEKESMQNRMVYDSLNGFFFDDSNGKLTEIDGKKSYTFTVYRRNGDDKIENIIFNEKENGEYEALFAKYDYSKEEMLSLTQEELETKDPIITDLNSNRQQLCVEYKEYICVPSFNGDLVGQYAEMDCSWVTVWEICSGTGGEVGVPHNYDATQYGSPSEPYDNNNTNPGGLSTSAVLPTQAGEFVNSLGFTTVDEFLSLPDAVKTIIFTYLYNNNYSNQVVTPTKYALQHFNYLWFSELSESLQVAIMNYLTQNNFSSESKNNINEIQHFLAQNQNSQEVLSFAYQAVKNQNSTIINDMFIWMNENENSQESIIASTLTLTAINNNILQNGYTPEVANILNQNANVDFVDPTYFAYFSVNCAILKVQHPDWSDYKIYWEASKEMVHLALDIGGLVPVIGEVCDLANGVIYTIEGDGVNAGLSFASTIPIAGWFTTGAKFAYKGTLKYVVKADGLIDFGVRNSKKFREALGLIVGDGKHAHHLIPWELTNNPIVQKAAKSSNPFHIDDALMNGIPLPSTSHLTGHQAYNTKISQILSNLNTSNPNMNYQTAYNHLQSLNNQIQNLIITHPSYNLGQIADLISYP